MAKSRDEEREELRRKRQREEERDQEEALDKLRKQQARGGTAGLNDSSAELLGSVDPTILFASQLQQAQSLIDQVNSLYAQFLAGVERKQPHEARARLETLIDNLQKAQKPTAAYQFRFNGLKATYTTYRDRWDKLIKDFESGKRRGGF